MQTQVARLPSARSNIPSRPLPSRHEGFDEVLPPTHLPQPQDSNRSILEEHHPATEADRNPQSVGYLSRLRRVTSRIPRPGQSMDENDNYERSHAEDAMGENAFPTLSHGYLEQLSPKGMDPGRFASICEKFESMQLVGAPTEAADEVKEVAPLRKCRSSVSRSRGRGGGWGGGRGRGGSRAALRSQSARYAMLDSVGSLTGVSSSGPKKDLYGKPRVAEAGVFGNMYVLNANDSDGGVGEAVRGGGALSGEEMGGWRRERGGLGSGLGSGGSSREMSSEMDNSDESDGEMSAVRYNDDSARYSRPLADRQWRERLQREASTAQAAPVSEACSREAHVTSPVTPVLEDRLLSVEEVDGENSCRDASEYEDVRETASIIGVAGDLPASDFDQAADSPEGNREVEVGGRDQDRGYQISDGQLHNEEMMEWGENEEEEGVMEERQQGELLRSSISTAVAAVDELREQLTAGAYRSHPEPRILEEKSDEDEGKEEEEEEGGEAIPGVRRATSHGQQNGSFDSMWSVDFPDPAGIISPSSDFVEVFNSYGCSEDMPSSLFTRDGMDSVGIDKAWDHLFSKQAARPPMTDAVEEAAFDSQSRSESRDGTYLELECCPADEISERFPEGLSHHQLLYLGSAPEFTGLGDLESAMSSVGHDEKAWTTECNRTLFDHEEECQASCSTPDSESTYCSAVSTSSRENEKGFGDPLPFLDPVFQSMRSAYTNGQSQNGTGRCSYSWSGDPWKNLRLACAADKIPHSARDTFDRPPLRFDVCLRSAEPSPKSRESSKSSSMAGGDDDTEFPQIPSEESSSMMADGGEMAVELPPPPIDIEYHSTSESVNGAPAVEHSVERVVRLEEEIEVYVEEEEREEICPARTESVATCSVADDDVVAMASPVAAERRKFKFYTKMVAMMKSVVPKKRKAVKRVAVAAPGSRQSLQDVTSPQLLNGCMPKLLHWKGSHDQQPHHKTRKKKHAKNRDSTATKTTTTTKVRYTRQRTTRSSSERSASDDGASSSRRRFSASLRSSTKGSVRGSGSSSHKYSRRHMFLMDKIENERLGMNSQPRSRRGVVRESIDMLWLRRLSKTS